MHYGSALLAIAVVLMSRGMRRLRRLERLHPPTSPRLITAIDASVFIVPCDLSSFQHT